MANGNGKKSKRSYRRALGRLPLSCVALLLSGYVWLGATDSAALASEGTEEGIADERSIVDERSLDFVRSQLTNLDLLPLLPTDPSLLDAASDQLSPTELSAPSFSWIRDQLDERYDSRTLIQQWRAYTTPSGISYVDVIVEKDTWEQLSYFRRYSFLVQFGITAQTNRYQLRVFHSGDVVNRSNELAVQDSTFGAASSNSVRLRGAYLCDHQPLPPSGFPQSCESFLNSFVGR